MSTSGSPSSPICMRRCRSSAEKPPAPPGDARGARVSRGRHAIRGSAGAGGNLRLALPSAAASVQRPPAHHRDGIPESIRSDTSTHPCSCPASTRHETEAGPACSPGRALGAATCRIEHSACRPGGSSSASSVRSTRNVQRTVVPAAKRRPPSELPSSPAAESLSLRPGDARWPPSAGPPRPPCPDKGPCVVLAASVSASACIMTTSRASRSMLASRDPAAGPPTPPAPCAVPAVSPPIPEALPGCSTSAGHGWSAPGGIRMENASRTCDGVSNSSSERSDASAVMQGPPCATATPPASRLAPGSLAWSPIRPARTSRSETKPASESSSHPSWPMKQGRSRDADPAPTLSGAPLAVPACGGPSRLEISWWGPSGREIPQGVSSRLAGGPSCAEPPTRATRTPRKLTTRERPSRESGVASGGAASAPLGVGASPASRIMSHLTCSSSRNRGAAATAGGTRACSAVAEAGVEGESASASASPSSSSHSSPSSSSSSSLSSSPPSSPHSASASTEPHCAGSAGISDARAPSTSAPGPPAPSPGGSTSLSLPAARSIATCASRRLTSTDRSNLKVREASAVSPDVSIASTSPCPSATPQEAPAPAPLPASAGLAAPVSSASAAPSASSAAADLEVWAIRGRSNIGRPGFPVTSGAPPTCPPARAPEAAALLDRQRKVDLKP
eukprot:scaffold14471_cov113-Isochrysis_galbana.AAC.4